MLKLILMEQNAEMAVYNYYPEGEGEPGSISIDKRTGKINVLHVPPNDEYGHYKIHAIQRISEYFDKQVFRKKDVVAWY